MASQIFWASRFKPGHEREYVFETRRSKQRDWITLYQRTKYAHGPPGFKNRRRIWCLIRTLIVLINLRLDDCSGFLHTPSSADSLKWNKVAGDVKQTIGSRHGEVFREGCRLFQVQNASIPGDLSKIAFSFLAVGDVIYITGIRLITRDDSQIRLGYLAEDNEASNEVTAVKGFILAVGPRGIRAVQVIGVNGYASKWVGSAAESPVTERLAGCELISNLAVGFDLSRFPETCRTTH